MSESDNTMTYADAGVNIDEGNRLIDLIKPMARSTFRAGSDTGLGGFGGIFDLKAAGFDDPLLVAGTDGVGTKLRIAIDTGKVSTVGIDLVAMCVNDVLAQGAEPLFFLDYFATGKLSPDHAAKVVSGIAEGCRQAGCALIGGETAEMPGMYEGQDFDLAGFVVGAVERKKLLPKHDDMKADDVLIGLASSGPHSNGYSLIRKIVEKSGLDWTDASPFAQQTRLADALLTPTKIYISTLMPLIRNNIVKGVSHITGGGLIENIPRMLPEHLSYTLDMESWERPDIFTWLQETGHIEEAEMQRAFNCGIGLVIAVPKRKVKLAMAALKDSGETAYMIGHLKDA